MALVYDESVRGKGGFSTPISEWSPEAVMAAWTNHVENRAYLAFLSTNGNFPEKTQACAELKICERKLAFWERHPAFDKVTSKVILDKVRSQWKTRANRG